MSSILIKNINIISMDESKEKIFTSNVYIKEDTIKYIGADSSEADTVIDGTGKYLLPGLINCHTHLPMSIFRESSEGYELNDWLKDKIWPAEEKLTQQDVYYGTLASCIEMIKSGTTTSNDSYFLTEGIIEALKLCKVRNVTTRVLLDLDGKGEQRIKEFENCYDSNKDNELITFTVSPHSLYTCSKDYLVKCEKLATKYRLPIHIHFSENECETKDIEKKHGMLPSNFLESINYTKHHLILAHGLDVKEEEYNILKNIKGGIVHNPVSNLRLGCGIANISKYIQQGILVALGTDGQGSGSNLDMWRTMGITALLQKGLNKDPKAINAYEVLKLATVNGAKMLKLEDKIGVIKEGFKADVVILNIDRIELCPKTDVVSQIIYNGTGDMVETTIVNGEILMLDKKLILDDISEKDIIEKIEQIAKRIM